MCILQLAAFFSFSDGWTRRELSLVMGCGRDGDSMRLVSSCEEDSDDKSKKEKRFLSS